MKLLSKRTILLANASQSAQLRQALLVLAIKCPALVLSGMSLARGEITSDALRDAKLALLAKFGDQVSPYYWAAFIPVGETSESIGVEKQ